VIRVRKKELCSECGEIRRVEKRTADKSPICDRCYKKHHAKKKMCSICGKIQIIEKNIDDKVLCGRCNKIGYSPPKKICSLCNRLGIIRKVEGNKKICSKCYKSPPKNCSVCGRNKKVNVYVNDQPVCGTCYKGKKENCIICNKVKEVYLRNENGVVCKKCYRPPKKICSLCGKNKEVNKLENNKPICISCYKTPKRICVDCKKMKHTYGYDYNHGALCHICFVRFYRKNNEASRLKGLLRCRVGQAFKSYSKNGKMKPSKKYGIDYGAIVKHLGPCPGNREDYHIDHIFPLSAFDFNIEEQVKLAFVPENHQWLKKEDNLSKNAKYNKDELNESTRKYKCQKK